MDQGDNMEREVGGGERFVPIVMMVLAVTEIKRARNFLAMRVAAV